MICKKNEIFDAIKSLKSGNLVVYPTDTLYALGADIFNEDSIRKVFEVKKRPFSSPLPVAVDNFSLIDKIAFTDYIVERIVEKFLPGPLTIILRKKEVVSDLLTSDLENIAVRIPDNIIALDLLSKYGRPLTVTSANLNKKETPFVIKDIRDQLNNNDISVYLDDGVIDGIPSTIVDLTFDKPRVIRKGSISEKEILDAI